MPTRRQGPPSLSGGRRAAAGLCALAIGLCATSARAYPSSVVFAPSGEALPFGSFAAGLYAGVIFSPPPVQFGSAWGGLDIGVLPSFDIATTPAGKLAFGGAEFGFDMYGPDKDGSPTFVLNAKLQLVKDAKYWPALAVGLFQIAPDPKRGALLGYFALSKSFAIGETDLGQLTFGMMRSFADSNRIAPQCFVSGAPYCLFRGTIPFEDQNGGVFAGYLSPWFGPVSFSIDHLGGTSPVSSSNLAVNFRLWQDGAGGYATVGFGGFVSNDRRGSPPGPGTEDGFFVTASILTSLTGLFGWDPTREWAGSKKKGGHHVRSGPEDPLDAPPLTPPTPTNTPAPATPPTAPEAASPG